MFLTNPPNPLPRLGVHVSCKILKKSLNFIKPNPDRKSLVKIEF